jgi:hypothetical protein
MKACTRTLLFAACFGAPIVVLACVLIAANGGSDLAKGIAAISVGLAAVEAVWSVAVRVGRSLRPMIEKARWFAFHLELGVRNRIRLRGARVCMSLKDASKRPLSVGLLRLLSSVGQDYPNPFHDCVAILPALRNLRELELVWLPWTALPRELSRSQRLRSVVVLNMPIREFPAFLADCSALQKLKLRGTDIDKLPDRTSVLTVSSLLISRTAILPRSRTGLTGCQNSASCIARRAGEGRRAAPAVASRRIRILERGASPGAQWPVASIGPTAEAPAAAVHSSNAPTRSGADSVSRGTRPTQGRSYSMPQPSRRAMRLSGFE